MKLRLKAVLVVSISMSLFITVLLSFLAPLLLKESTERDKAHIAEEIKRIHNRIESNMENLQIMNRDWAIWDDTYNFMKVKNTAFVKNNLDISTLENNQLNFVLFINNENEAILQKGYDTEKKEPIDLEDDFYKSFLLLIQNKEKVSDVFLVETSKGFSMSSIETIYQSDGGGPPTGKLIMGKFISEATIQEMGKELSLELKLQKVAASTHPTKYTLLNEEELKGSLQLVDYFKQHVYEISFDNYRNYYLQKKETVNQIVFYMIIISIVFILLILFTLNRFIIAPVSNLSKQLNQIQKQGDVKSRVVGSNRKDELGILERSINQTLTALEEKHNEVFNLAYYDPLTTLPNRFMFFQEVEKRLSHSQSEVFLVFLDLDGFKQVNDTFGHKIGDILLRKVADRVRPIIEEKNGIMARYGGDEFLILFNNINKTELEAIIQVILTEVEKDFLIEGFTTSVTASIGVSLYPQDGSTVEQILKNADIAMYEAKRSGKNQYIFFENLGRL